MAKSKRKVAMCLMAHPDDCEFMVAGTMALLAKRGWECHIVSSTPGDCGSMEKGPEEIGNIRREENRRAAAIIGATYHCLELRDLYVTYDHDSIRRALNVTRDIAPSLMFTHPPLDYMGDHEITSMLARAASIGYFVPNCANGPIKPGSATPHLYYADPAGTLDYYGNRPTAETYVDISKVMSTKEKMLKAHASQRSWLQAHYGIDEYTRLMKNGSAVRGEEVGLKYAEAFRQHRGQGYPKDDMLREELGELVKAIAM
jgi:LmbE family N-acetylglucosaminyl deacetylase